MDNSPAPTAADRVGQNVRRVRAERGLTLAQLSAELTKLAYPIGVATLSKIERGDRNIKVDDLAALAQALDLTVSHLLGSANPVAHERLMAMWNESEVFRKRRDEDTHRRAALEDELENLRSRQRRVSIEIDQIEDRIVEMVEQDATLLEELPRPMRNLIEESIQRSRGPAVPNRGLRRHYYDPPASDEND